MLCRQFVSCAGFTIHTGNIHTVTMEWRKHADKLRGKSILNTIPTILAWELWKRRNVIKYEKSISYCALQNNCQKTIQQPKVVIPSWERVPKAWEESYELL